jgi:TatD DNase family protein
MFIDTHAHLDDGQFPDVDAVIAASHEAGVERIINIGYRPGRWQSTIDLTRRHPSVAFCLGIHPSEADHFGPEAVDALAELIRTEQPVGIGESGIDLFRDGPGLAQQQATFAFQIELAIEHGLPLVIHQRAAENEVYDQLAGADQRLRVVLHSFDASRRTLDLAAERGWFVGVGGLMTRQSASEVREVLKFAPLDHLLLETDSPYLVPAGIKDRRNSPENIPVIARRLADLLGLTTDEIAARTTANALRAFPRLGAVAAQTSGAYAS